jgi:hypothetical protein
MKSITKRRLKTRSIGRNTLNRRHKRRHSNRRWGAGQNKSRKKRMIGGSVGYKRGGGLTRLFNNGWKCDCNISQDSSSKSATAPAEHLTGQSSRPNAHNSIAAVTAPKSSSSPFKRREAQSNIKDATLKGKYLINDDFNSVEIDETPTIIINTKRGADALPKYLENGQFITKVNNIDIKINTLTDFYRILETNAFYDKPVVLTVAMGSAGGFGSNQFKVQVTLKKDMPRQGNVGGGKKTTYRRKNHVTRRKINTKRMKVMVGGYVLHKEVECHCTKEIKEGKGKGKGKGVSESVSESKGVSVSKGVSESKGVSVSKGVSESKGVSDDEGVGVEM